MQHKTYVKPDKIFFCCLFKGKPQTHLSPFVYDICCLGRLLTMSCKLIKIFNFFSFVSAQRGSYKQSLTTLHVACTHCSHSETCPLTDFCKLQGCCSNYRWYFCIFCMSAAMDTKGIDQITMTTRL